MAIEIINVGSAPNDGQGDPVRTAYIKTNNNFTELNARAQTSPPATLVGVAGDVAGMYAYASNDFYFCFQDYDGSSIIWAVLNTSGNVVVTGIASGTSNVAIPSFSGPVRIGVGGVGNVAVFANTGASITGNLTTTGNLNAGNIITGNVSGTLITAAQPNITSVGTLTELTVSGNILPSANVTYDLGSSSQRFNDLYLAGNSIDLAGATITANSTAVVITNPAGGSFTVSGTSAATASSLVNGTSNIIVGASGNVTVSSAGTANVLVASGTGVNVSGTLNTSGNITGGNLTTAGKIDATGNITTAEFFIGTLIGNIIGNLVVPGLNTYVLYNNSGNAGADSGFTYASGTVTVTGNIAAGNLTTGGQVVATGNVSGGNLTTGGVVAATGNVSGGNVTTGGVVAATGNVSGGNVTTGGQVVASGNVSGNYILGNGSQLTSVTTSVLQNGTSNVAIAAANDYVRVKVNGVANVAVFTETATYLAGILEVTGNVVSANLNSNGAVSGATGVFSGNVSANYFTGNGSALTGIDATAIQNGTSNVRVAASGNVTVSSAGNANILIVTSTGANIAGTLNVTGNATVGNLSATNITGTLTTASQTNITAVGNLTLLDVTGNVSTGNVSGATGTFTNVAGTLSTVAQTNITSVGTLTSLTVTGNASAGNLTVSTGTVSVGNIVNTNANGVGNIGTVTNYFNTVHAQATSAQYADLAEYYAADADYAPGTVVILGGEKEITVTVTRADARVIGAVSTNPAYIMNAQSPGVAVALRGRIPVNVVGPVTKGDSLVTSTTPGFAESIGTDCTYGQSVFAKSLETNPAPGKKTVEVLIL